MEMVNQNTAAEPTFVVVILNDNSGKSYLLKIGITVPNFGHVDPRVFYVRHGLETCSPPFSVEGPIFTDEMEVYSAVSLRSFAYFFHPRYPKYLIMNFSQSPAIAKYSPFPYETAISNLLLIDEKIYAFGQDKRGVLYAYTTPLDKLEWEPLSLPKTACSETRFVVVSLGKMVLTLHVDNQLQSVYDPKLKTWSNVDYKGLLPLFGSIADDYVTVDEHNTFYWLDSELNIRGFNYQLCQHYCGRIVGFTHEPILRGRDCGSAKLIHVMGWLFGLVWLNEPTKLHLTLLHVAHGPKPSFASRDENHLFVNVVSCFHHRIHPDIVVDGALKL